MLTEFQDHLAATFRAMEKQKALCAAPQPDHPALAHGRWQLAQLGRRRVNFLVEKIFPLAERHAATRGGAGLLAIRETWPAFRKTASAFLARWPAQAISADWEGYRRDATAFRLEITRRLQQEEECLREMLAEIERQASPPGLAPCQLA